MTESIRAIVCGAHYERLSVRDAYEVRAFHRFLGLGLSPFDGMSVIRRDFVGWLPYVTGVGPSPPEGFDAVPVTAWTVPS